MSEFGDHSPRRYFVDKGGRRVLIGLTVEETFEFETLDSASALDHGASRLAWDEKGQPTTLGKSRWLELYGKHDKAWREWKLTQAETNLINH